MEGSTFPDPSQANPAPDLHELIRRRAEEIYFRNGRIPGRDAENWAQAEHEIRQEVEASRKKTAIVVRVNGMHYVGEYRPELADGYVPGEFGAGTPVDVRLDGDRMLVKRPNGKVLETRIVQKIR
ncbi:MAG TPA: DUF2934 domain-containing protein [Candidatus Dormibacteraeota bacterium]|nr:DUF2934 domain-containing protein [Candidatus Dormibacteraeota bacterium]